MLLAASVSVEPPPKQGCEQKRGALCYPLRSLSGTPAEAGVRVEEATDALMINESQWNPRRSRGARRSEPGVEFLERSLSGTPAEAGVRALRMVHQRTGYRRLSGTPAEAGVRAR